MTKKIGGEVKRQDEFDAAYRASLASLVEALAACVQSLSWLTWKAQKAPASVTADRLSFRTAIRSQMGGRVKDIRGDRVELRVTGTTGAYAHATPSVPGPVFVIERRRRPGGRPDIIHYAPELGAAVYLETPFGDAERLVAWH